MTNIWRFPTDFGAQSGPKSFFCFSYDGILRYVFGVALVINCVSHALRRKKLALILAKFLGAHELRAFGKIYYLK